VPFHCFIFLEKKHEEESIVAKKMVTAYTYFFATAKPEVTPT
jgi:hypothetical protein